MKTLTLLMLCLFAFQSKGQLLIVAKEKGKKYGYLDESGSYVIQPQYDAAGAFYGDYAVVRLKKKFGVIDRVGKMVIPAIYDDAIDYSPDALFTLKKNGKWGVLNDKGDVVIPFEHEFLSNFKNGYVVSGRAVSGWYDDDEETLFCATIFNHNGDTVYYSDDCTDMSSLMYGYIDKKDRYIIFNPYPMVSEEGYTMFMSTYSWTENRLIKLQPNNLEHEEKMMYELIEELDYMNPYGDAGEYSTKSFQYMVAMGFPFASGQTNVREGFLAINVRYMTEEDWDLMEVIDYEKLRKKGILIDASNWKQLEVDAEEVYPFFNGISAVVKEGKWAFLNNTGEIVSLTNVDASKYQAYPPMYFGELIGLFNPDGKAGYINLKGEVVIPFQFDEYHPFEYDITPVKYKKKYGMIRKDGSWAIEPKYEYLGVGYCPCYQ